MKKLFFILPILMFISPLRSMEVPKKQDNKDIDSSAMVITLPNQLTLPQIYYLFKHNIFDITDIAKHIFSVMPGMDSINDMPILLTQEEEYKGLCPCKRLTKCIKTKLHDYGYRYTVELLRHNLIRENISICDVHRDGINLLHHVAYDDDSDTYVDVARLYLDVAGKEAWNLLTAKTAWGDTPLTYAAVKDHVMIAKLFLDTAGKYAETLVTTSNDGQWTALTLAKPAAKKLMLQYLQKDDCRKTPVSCTLM